MINYGARMIIKLMKLNGYHVLIQDACGKIIHEEFNDESQAREFIKQFLQPKVKLENVD